MAQPKVKRQATRAATAGYSVPLEVVQLDYNWNSTGGALVLDIPADAGHRVQLVDLIHIVRVLFSGGTPSIDVGDGSDIDAFIDTTDVTEGTAGDIARMSTGVSADAVKKDGQYLTANLPITLTLSASLAAGAGTLLALIYRFE